MKRRVCLITMLFILIASAALVQASPIDFKQGDWKIGLGNGKLTFENGTMHVTDYKSWSIIQFGANTDAGQFSLAGSTGIQFEIKAVEPTTIEVALQLEDWAFTVVHKQAIQPSDGWATIEVDLSKYDLSVINALSMQGSGGDFSLRNMAPTPIFRAESETASEIKAPASNIKITGKTNLDIVVQHMEYYETHPVPPSESPIAFNTDDWKLEDGVNANLEFGDNSLTITNYPGWKRIERKKGDDLSAYAGIQFEVKVEAYANVQFIIQPKNWGWNQIYQIDHAPEDGWVTVQIIFEEHGLTPEDMSEANALIFQAGGVDWAIRNITLIPPSEFKEKIDFVRSYAVDLGLNYTINDDWTASINTKVAEESFNVGLVEVKGTPGDLNVRAFLNGTGANLGDPMNAIQGTKYNNNKTFGIDLKAPIHTGSAHFFASTPVSDIAEGGLIGASYKMPVEDAEVQLLAATEFLNDADKKQPYIIGVAASGAFDAGLGLTGEILFSGKKGLGFYGKASWRNLEAGITNAPADLWTQRGNFHANDGYGTYYFQGNTNIMPNLNLGFYFNQWYNHKEGTDKYKNLLAKLYGEWKFGERATFNAAYERKTKQNQQTKKYDNLEESKLLLTLNGQIITALDGKLINIITNEGDKSLKVPALVGRLTYGGLNKWTIIGELGLTKAASDAKFKNNIHLRAKYHFTPGGSLELGFGKPTLNDDDNTVINRSTPKHYYTLKFRFSF